MTSAARCIAWALLAVSTLLTTVVNGSQPSLSATASTDSVRVVEPFTLSISVRADQGAKVAFPDVADKLGTFEVHGVQDVFDVPDADDPRLRIWTRRLTLDSVETGELQIPPVNVQVTQSGQATQLTTQPIAVRVVSVLEDRSDPTKFRDIQSVVDLPLPEPRPTRTIPWVAVGSLALVVLALSMAAVAYRRRPGVAPLVWASRQLDALHPDTADVAQRLSRILREFLILHFQVPEVHPAGFGQSAQEIVQTLCNLHRMDASTADRLQRIFDVTDRAKFAGLPLSPAEAERDIADAREILASFKRND